MNNIDSEKYMALSRGGFAWSESGKVTSLTENEAVKLSSKSEVKRDPNSQSLYFEYVDENKEKHTVWYADSDTICNWINISKNVGYDKIALWRLGGSEKQTLKDITN